MRSTKGELLEYVSYLREEYVSIRETWEFTKFQTLDMVSFAMSDGIIFLLL